jgi:ParB family transcriptional regulator, chromosome partitioning protein
MTSFATVEDLQEIEYLALDELDASPLNPRKTLDPVKVAELAESIREHGILVPLLIRRVPIEGDVVAYHIIAGSRRAAAGKIAGKTEAPCIVREMTDYEARELAIVDNLQRADMEPLEEAQSFNDAMTLAFGRMLTVQELAVRLGKSPVYINSRLTLLDAILAVQAALRGGLIDVGHALELARLSESEQERLLSWLDVGYVVAEDGDEVDDDSFVEDDEDDTRADPLAASGARRTAKSLVELRSYISRTTLRILGEAPFDPNDETLVVEAGSCGSCLKRSGANQLLFSDVRGEDVCTDRTCFDGKVKAFVARKMADAKAAKRPLHQITEEWGKKGPQTHYAYQGLKEAGKKRCGFLVEAIHVDGRSIGKVIEICISADCKVHGSGGSSSSRAVSSEKEKADRKALLAKVKVEKDYRSRLFKELIAKPIAPEPTDDMVRALVLFAFTRFDSTKHAQIAEALAWDKDIFGWHSGEKKRLAKLATLTQADAIRIALVALEASELQVHENEVGNKRELDLEKVARLIGVDSASVRASIAGSPAPKPAVEKPPIKKVAPAKKAAKKAAKKKAVRK